MSLTVSACELHQLLRFFNLDNVKSHSHLLNIAAAPPLMQHAGAGFNAVHMKL